jgi:photosystem II stability/assembly factor-like uncharacterized protein
MRIPAAGIASLAVLCLAACAPTPDDAPVKAEREKAVQRYDNFQAAASDGKRLASAGGMGVLVTSADGGTTWAREVLPSPASVVGMSACPDGTFAALDFYRKVWIGDGQGRNWQPRRLEADFNPLAIACDARDRLWVVGSFTTILSSSDHGKTWSAQPPGDDAILTAMQWVDADHGFIVGEFGTLLVTLDGGATWAKQPGLPSDFYPYSLVFTDIRHGWVSGVAGTVLHTIDGGKTWVSQTNATGAPMYALLHAGERVFGVGGAGRLIILNGDQWVAVANTPRFASYLAAGAPLEPRGVLVAGAAGALQVVSFSTPVSGLTAPAGRGLQP